MKRYTRAAVLDNGITLTMCRAHSVDSCPLSYIDCNYSPAFMRVPVVAFVDAIYPDGHRVCVALRKAVTIDFDEHGIAHWREDRPKRYAVSELTTGEQMPLRLPGERDDVMTSIDSAWNRLLVCFADKGAMREFSTLTRTCIAEHQEKKQAGQQDTFGSWFYHLRSYFNLRYAEPPCEVDAKRCYMAGLDLTQTFHELAFQTA